MLDIVINGNCPVANLAETVGNTCYRLIENVHCMKRISGLVGSALFYFLN
jgi:hypothetical protein